MNSTHSSQVCLMNVMWHSFDPLITWSLVFIFCCLTHYIYCGTLFITIDLRVVIILLNTLIIIVVIIIIIIILIVITIITIIIIITLFTYFIYYLFIYLFILNFYFLYICFSLLTSYFFGTCTYSTRRESFSMILFTLGCYDSNE